MALALLYSRVTIQTQWCARTTLEIPYIILKWKTDVFLSVHPYNIWAKNEGLLLQTMEYQHNYNVPMRNYERKLQNLVQSHYNLSQTQYIQKYYVLFLE